MRASSRFLRQYRDIGRPAARSERVLAIGRAFLTVSALAAIYLDPSEPARLREITYAVLLGYAAYSVGLLAFVHSSSRMTNTDAKILHGLDILWSSLLTFVSAGPVSPFFLFFLFSVLAAAFRWGFRETVATTVVSIAVFLLETTIASFGPWSHSWFAEVDFELNRTILRVAYTLLTGFVLGYLAEQERRAQAEMAAIAEVMRIPRVDIGLGGSIIAVARSVLSMFDARSAAIVLHEHETRRTLLWKLEASPDRTRPPLTERRELTAADTQNWLFADEGHAWLSSPASGSGVVWATEAGVWPLKRVNMKLPPQLSAAGAAKTITAINVGFAPEWQGRVYLFDAAETSEDSLHFLEALADYVTPPLTNVFLLRRLRARAGAAERARVARELHDGAIQALFGLEMKVEALRRTSAVDHVQIDDELTAIQGVIRSEVLGLRDLMHALRPIEIDDGDQLPDVLASVVERFRRDSGVSARFVSSGGRPVLPSSTALEVVRIVQEALVNVRKHSRARNVLVRMTRDDHRCTIVIEDDGCGFDFAGRLSGEVLDREHLGPAIIKERSRIAGATLTVDSTPGEGARLEISLQEAAHA